MRRTPKRKNPKEHQMNYSKPIRWGVIGLGWFGEVHADNLAEMPDIELTALCTRRPERLAEIADRLGVEKRYTDYHKLLADPDVDVVSVTTHFYDHRQITIDALRRKTCAAGKTHGPDRRRLRSNHQGGRRSKRPVYGGPYLPLRSARRTGERSDRTGTHRENHLHARSAKSVEGHWPSWCWMIFPL